MAEGSRVRWHGHRYPNKTWLGDDNVEPPTARDGDVLGNNPINNSHGNGSANFGEKTIKISPAQRCLRCFSPHDGLL